MPDWNKIKAEYIRGGTSYRKLANKYGVSFSAVKRRAAKEKWTDLRTQSGQKATTKIIESTAGQEAKRVSMFDTIADKLLNKISEEIDNNQIFALNKYRDITGALKDLKEIKGIKTELDVKEQIARIDKLRKDIEGNDADKTVTVVISPEAQKYSK